MRVREATAADVPDLVRLADRKRWAYEPHAPVFHRPARDAADVHRAWLEQRVVEAAGLYVASEGFTGPL